MLTNCWLRPLRAKFCLTGTKGIYMSLLHKTRSSIDWCWLIDHCRSHRRFRAIKAATGIVVDIKWVNDLYYQDKKICGILSTEPSLILKTNRSVISWWNRKQFCYDPFDSAELQTELVRFFKANHRLPVISWWVRSSPSFRPLSDLSWWCFFKRISCAFTFNRP